MDREPAFKVQSGNLSKQSYPDRIICDEHAYSYSFKSNRNAARLSIRESPSLDRRCEGRVGNKAYAEMRVPQGEG